MRLVLLLISILALGACTSSGGPKEGSIPTEALLATSAAGATTSGEYRIGATDLLRINVFRVPDLSFEEIRVDASGVIQMPLIGTVQAEGLTPDELSASLATRLGAQYLRNPQITVTVLEAASQKITVDGAVTQPGVYEMQGRTTLLQAVAMARGPVAGADLKSVVIFRTIDGQRQFAVFDLAAIRAGEAPDPVVLGDDVIVVDTSFLSDVIQQVVRAAPSLYLFRTI
ncbi:polysaccharide biosynthesis/export family protein [Brevundimonas poindexterae]|uniref:polysaccharide biosynthesis/export family protein n=1 Tax=Brevundimonas poindexterae TaxID=74325 RepID=UPI001CFEC27B|nr:polysaccharide biosynthesis/export family protein [Brevundimonas poindexterae]